jgi:hypothetical protein
LAFQRRILPTDGRYIAARTLDFGDRVIAEGAEFPWREMNMDEREVQRRWWIGELEAAKAVQPPESLPTGAEQPVASHVQYDATTSIDTSKLSRRSRRALRNQG